MKKIYALFSLLIVSLISVHAQVLPYQSLTFSELREEVKKLQNPSAVLYLAAHPDDENTRLISYLSKEVKFQTAYLSLTRGDGGQNLIGPEVRERLGMIRTEELLAARNVDGGTQFFTRANDFGYSKHPDETLAIWKKDSVLADIVRVIRKFKPELIITRFSPNSAGETHGHHTSSALLAMEAFKASADPTKFPEQVPLFGTHQVRRIVFNTSPWFFRNKPEYDTTKLVKVDVGSYNEWLGMSYGEIAANSRSQHKSQGFGSAAQRGEVIEYFEYLDGETVQDSPFDGIPTNWSQVPEHAPISELINKILANFQPEAKDAITLDLLKLRTLFLSSKHPKAAEKIKSINTLLLQLNGGFIEALSTQAEIAKGDSLKISLELIQRSGSPLLLKKVSGMGIEDKELNSTLGDNTIHKYPFIILTDAEGTLSHPYYLRTKGTEGLYSVENYMEVGMPRTPSPYVYTFSIQYPDGQVIDYERELMYKWTDPVKGECYKSICILPEVSINFNSSLKVFSSTEPKKVQLTITNNQGYSKGVLHIEIPKGWKADPLLIPFEMTKKGSVLVKDILLYPSELESQGTVLAKARMDDGKEVNTSFEKISYDHIPELYLQNRAEIQCIRFTLKKKGDHIAYISGAGDQMAESLREVGYTVDVLSADQILGKNLHSYSAVICGIRLANVTDNMDALMPSLLKYVEEGGTLLMQYNTTGDLKTKNLGPYPFSIGRNRITDENAPLEFTLASHPVLNKPNELTKADFEGWVQERGLYFAQDIDPKYELPLLGNDPSEDPQRGMLLVAKYGKGAYIYSPISFFRQLPAGVPGAFRLFVNLISYKP